MTEIAANDPDMIETATASATRAPMQKRAQASLERMLTATETLLIERGSGAFTLQEVSRVGKVSIGSIYFRFDSKETLIRAVHERVMRRMEEDHDRLIARARARTLDSGPVQRVQAVIEEVGDFLKHNAPLLHPLMMCAQGDEAVRERGARSYQHLSSRIRDELATLSDHIHRSDAEDAMRSALDIAFAAYARELGLGLAERAVVGQNWPRIRAHMGEMAAAFLFMPKAS